jgi:hypothetical protein
VAAVQLIRGGSAADVLQAAGTDGSAVYQAPDDMLDGGGRQAVALRKVVAGYM